MPNPTNRQQLRTELGADPGVIAGKELPTKLEKVVPQARKEVKLRHHESCQEVRRSSPASPKECTCEANLIWLAESGVKPLERRTLTWDENELAGAAQKPVTRTIELWRMDTGLDHWITVPDTSPFKRPKPKLLKLPPRWICTRCGWASRGSDISHRCDIASVRRQSKLSSVAAGLTFEQRTSGAYRLAIWRDGEGLYHLVEELVIDGQVKAMVEVDRDGNYNVIEGALLSASVDGFDP